MNNRMGFVVAVKQVFETYVYDPGLSSVGQMPFVLTRVSVRHGEACGGMPHGFKDEQNVAERLWERACLRCRRQGVSGSTR